MLRVGCRCVACSIVCVMWCGVVWCVFHILLNWLCGVVWCGVMCCHMYSISFIYIRTPWYQADTEMIYFARMYKYCSQRYHGSSHQNLLNKLLSFRFFYPNIIIFSFQWEQNLTERNWLKVCFLKKKECLSSVRYIFT